MERARDERFRQAAVGIGILVTLMVVVTSLLLGWRLLPGVLGEWLGTIMGIITTPFFMEATFAILGLMIVIVLNIWRQHRDGDEFVYLEQVSGPDVPADLPDQAKWAVFRDKPLEGEIPGLLTQAEGALAIGDTAAAAEFVSAMSPDELQQPETLRLRLDLARATGHTALAADLETQIRALSAN